MSLELYEVTATDMSNVGGGGSDRDRTTNFWKITTADSIDVIKTKCEQNYLDNTRRSTPREVTWNDLGDGHWQSNDLSSVMYYIKPVVIV